MANFNSISRFLSGGSDPVPISRLSEYFRQSFGEPVERAKTLPTSRRVRLSAGRMRARPGHRPPLTEEDVRIHAWLWERLAALHYERHGLWPRVNRALRAIARFMLWPFVRIEKFNTD
jgi:hypothetical protein